jgi:hypothetical protein
VAKSGGNAPQRVHRFGFAEMLRDVLVASIERGQFLIATISLILTIVVLKLPGETMSALIVRVRDSFDRACFLGYVIAAVLAVSWFWHSRRRDSR